jgi:2-aminoadipate transaminase
MTPPESPLARRMARVRASPIMELLKRTAQGGMINFASGLPDPALFPSDALRTITERILVEDGRIALQYGPAEGHPPLREYVAAMLRSRGIPATPERVLITHGSQQALDLAARLLLDPGDLVILEKPSYLAAIQVFDSHEAEYTVVGMDAGGMDVAEAASRLRERPAKLVFTLPNFQNPTGISMSVERRRALAELCAERGVAVLEDDAYHDLRYEGEALPCVAALAENPLAVYTGTFSKTIAPGLRVGFLYAAEPLVERLAELKQLTDLHSGSLTQCIALAFCLDGHLEPQMELLRDAYRRRRDAMLEALEAELAGFATWTRPEGGMFVFLTLPPELDAGAALPCAMERGVAFVPGQSFHADGSGRNTLRLNFVSAGEEEIRRGVAVLAEVLREAGVRREMGGCRGHGDADADGRAREGGV